MSKARDVFEQIALLREAALALEQENRELRKLVERLEDENEKLLDKLYEAEEAVKELQGVAFRNAV